ncbi:hypothetical protein V6N13_051307 [Hibiscus sabdariffa]|uniref:Uncharacterized protein n=1 Tax=Hibiscus sabdariffa TaxID=183260 RepID=A0ABR2T3W9_9ROSI
MYISLSSDDSHASQGFPRDDINNPNSSHHCHQLLHQYTHQAHQQHPQVHQQHTQQAPAQQLPSDTAHHPPGAPAAAHSTPKVHNRCCIVRHPFFTLCASWPKFQQRWFSKATIYVMEYTLFVHSFI